MRCAGETGMRVSSTDLKERLVRAVANGRERARFSKRRRRIRQVGEYTSASAGEYEGGRAMSAYKLATEVAPEWPGGHEVRLRGLQKRAPTG